MSKRQGEQLTKELGFGGWTIPTPERQVKPATAAQLAGRKLKAPKGRLGVTTAGSPFTTTQPANPFATNGASTFQTTQTPSFPSFGQSMANGEKSVFNFQAPQAASFPSFGQQANSDGNTASNFQPPQATPFAFGMSTANGEQSTFNSQPPQTTSFTFGQSTANGAQPTFNTEPTQTASFTFGQSTANGAQPAFNTQPSQTGSFTFGQSTANGEQNAFNSQPSKTASVTFGQSMANGEQNPFTPQPSKTTSFTFGQPTANGENHIFNSQAPQAASFNFGQSTANEKNHVFSSEAPQAPEAPQASSFIFGQSTVNAENSIFNSQPVQQPAFTFGQSVAAGENPIITSQPQQQPSVTFGQSKINEGNPTFNYQPPQPASFSFSTFGQSSEAPSTTSQSVQKTSFPAFGQPEVNGEKSAMGSELPQSISFPANGQISGEKSISSPQPSQTASSTFSGFGQSTAGGSQTSSSNFQPPLTVSQQPPAAPTFSTSQTSVAPNVFTLHDNDESMLDESPPQPVPQAPVQQRETSPISEPVKAAASEPLQRPESEPKPRSQSQPKSDTPSTPAAGKPRVDSLPASKPQTELHIVPGAREARSVQNLQTSKPIDELQRVQGLGNAAESTHPSSNKPKTRLNTHAPGSVPNFLDNDKRVEFDKHYRLRSLDAMLQQNIAQLNPAIHDFDNLIRFYAAARDTIGSPMGLYQRSKAGMKRRADATEEPQEGKRARTDDQSATPQTPIASFSRERLSIFQPTTTASITPVAVLSTGAATTVSTFPVATVSTTPVAAVSDNPVVAVPTTPVAALSTAPVAAVSSTPSSTSRLFANMIASPSTTLAPAFEVPKFGTGSGTNFMSSFAKQSETNAAKMAEEAKRKRKAEDFDSDEDDEAEFDREYEEEQRAKRNKIESLAKFGGFRPTFAEAQSSPRTATSIVAACSPEKEPDVKPIPSTNPVVASPTQDNPIRKPSEEPITEAPASVKADATEPTAPAPSTSVAPVPTIVTPSEDVSDDDDIQAAMAKSSNKGKSLFDRVERPFGTPIAPSWSPITPASQSVSIGGGTSVPTPPGTGLFASRPSTPPVVSGTSTKSVGTSLFGLQASTSSVLFGASSFTPAAPPGTGLFGSRPGTPSDNTWKIGAPIHFATSTISSRATSPGVTDTESIVTEEDQSNDAQTSLMDSRPGEEHEDVVFEARSKALKLMSTEQLEATGRKGADPGWTVQGLGPLRVLKDKATGKIRMVLRAEPGSNIVINTVLSPSMDYKVPEGKGNSGNLRFGIPTKEGIESWVLKLRTKAMAEELAQILEKGKVPKQD